MTDEVSITRAGSSVSATPDTAARTGVHDLRAGLVVFLIALPLCLGVANASGVPLLSGLIAGIVGGSVVALLSGSALSISGPAAGLTMIVLDGVQRLGFREFLVAGWLAGGFQIALGFLGAGRLAQLVPSAVIRGMLAAIGLILVLKQLPHALGYDADPEGDFSFAQRDGHNTFSELFYSLESLTIGALIVSAVTALTLLAWRNYAGLALTRFVPRELMAVTSGLLAALLLEGTPVELAAEHRVSIPLVSDHGLRGLWTMPAWRAIAHWEVWKTGFTLALVASLESLLCLEAIERIDPLHRVSRGSRELIAQGVGNMASSTLGGMPLTAVIVRSFTNVQAGGRTRYASMVHGALLLVATLGFAHALNHIPIAALAVVLIMVGLRLTPPALYRSVWQSGRAQFLPFITTVVAILLTDLLTGTLLGLAFAIAFLVWGSYSTAIVVTDDGPYRLIRFAAGVSFLHKARLKAAFESVPTGAHVVIDGTRARSVDPDIIEAITDFERSAAVRGIQLTVQRNPSALHDYFREAHP